MPNDAETPETIEVFFTSEFKRNIRQLAKKYRRIKSDLQPIIDELSQGQKPGDQIPGVHYEVFKVRMRNSDSAKGKSGGYRMIYQITEQGAIILVTVYSKTEQADIAPHEIREIITDYETQAVRDDEAVLSEDEQVELLEDSGEQVE